MAMAMAMFMAVGAGRTLPGGRHSAWISVAQLIPVPMAPLSVLCSSPAHVRHRTSSPHLLTHTTTREPPRQQEKEKKKKGKPGRLAISVWRLLLPLLVLVPLLLLVLSPLSLLLLLLLMHILQHLHSKGNGLPHHLRGSASSLSAAVRRSASSVVLFRCKEGRLSPTAVIGVVW